MSIRIHWDDDTQHTICLQVEGRWTWDDFYAAMSEMHHMMDLSPHPDVDFLVDMQNGSWLPDNLLSQMQRVSRGHHPKSNRMVMIGANAFVKAMFKMMERISPDRMQHILLAANLEEARQLLAQSSSL